MIFLLPEFEEVRDKITQKLQQIGWDKIIYSAKLPSSRSTIDIIATSKGVRKKRLIIIIGANEFDANISSMLLTGIMEKGKKIMFLQEGDPSNVKINSKILVLVNYNDLPAP